MLCDNLYLHGLVAARIDIPSRPLSISVVRNRSLALHCSATGTPTPTYSWIHDSQSVDISRSGYFLWPNGTLVVGNVGLEDAGDYVCTASNLLYSDMADVQTVTVHGEQLGHLAFACVIFKFEYILCSCASD